MSATSTPPRPKTHRLAGWLCVGIGGMYLLLTPLWLIWALGWSTFTGLFWPLEAAAVVAVVTGIVLVVRSGRVEAEWRDQVQRAQWAAWTTAETERRSAPRPD